MLIFAQFRTSRLNTVVFIAAPGIPRPAIESAEFDPCQIIWHEIAAQHIPLIDHSPKLSAMGLPCHAHRITHAAGEYAIAARLGIDLQDVGSVFFLVQTIFGDVAGRSNRDIEKRTVGAGDRSEEHTSELHSLMRISYADFSFT